MYNKIRRKFSLEYAVGVFPSSDYLLSLFSDDMYRHTYRPYSDIDSYDLEELLNLAFSDLTYLGDPFAPTNKAKKDYRSKSLELSRELLQYLSEHSPHVLIKLIRNSQADS